MKLLDGLIFFRCGKCKTVWVCYDPFTFYGRDTPGVTCAFCGASEHYLDKPWPGIETAASLLLYATNVTL